MNTNDNNTNSESLTITPADIEALRAALGAEAELQGVDIDTSTQAYTSTAMCPVQPWDN